jgi:hypothetical protein
MEPERSLPCSQEPATPLAPILKQIDPPHAIPLRSILILYSRNFSSPRRPDRLRGLLNLRSSWYRGLFPRGMKLTTHLQLFAEVKKMWIYTSTTPYAFMA